MRGEEALGFRQNDERFNSAGRGSGGVRADEVEGREIVRVKIGRRGSVKKVRRGGDG